MGAPVQTGCGNRAQWLQVGKGSLLCIGLLLLSACPESGDSQPPPASSTVVSVRTVDPTITDSAIIQTNGDHLVAIGTPISRIGRLLVFFPGAGGRPDQYSLLTSHAASRGYHTINLAYVNDQSVNVLCLGGTPTCQEEVRLEILTGEDRSPLVAVDRVNSIENRVIKLLQYLDLTFPGESWGSYLASGALRWDLMAFVGHSQGGGHAALIGKLHSVQRVILFSSTEPALWTTAPLATASDRYYGFVHQLDNSFVGMTRSWENLRLPGTLTTVDGAVAPYSGSHHLFTAVPTCNGSNSSAAFHQCPCTDEFTPREADGTTAAFRLVWDYVLGPDPAP